MTLKTTLALTLIATLIILSAGCIDNDAEPETAYITPTPTPNIVEPQSPIIVEVTPDEELLDYETISVVPGNYYNITIDQYFIDHKLYNYLDGYTWGRPVSVSSWSFREVTELEHELTEKGCNVTIRWVDLKTSITHTESDMMRVKTDDYERSGCQPNLDQVGCWLMIELDGELVAYDPIGCFWAFKPDHKNKNEYIDRRGRYHDWWYYKENTTYSWPYGSVTSYNFIDFADIYELEEYYLSGEMRTRGAGKNKTGVWWSYSESDEYNATDDFLISYGWWLEDEELRTIECRINRATDWFELIG